LINICIIPARGGSKRIPKKNIKIFLGYPIITYVIKMALKSKIFDKVIVSTDNKKIASIAKKCGAEIFKRSKKLSNDIAGTNEVICDVIKNYEKKFDIYKVCCLYPTSIFCTKNILQKAFKILNKQTKYVFSATKFGHPVFRSFTYEKNKILMLFPNKEKERTQDLPDVFHDAAQFYLGWKSSWLKSKSIFNKKSKFVEIKENLTQDIDNLSDWELAKIKYLKNK
jgi:pseudaminic acid cytidylyltransferase